MAKNIKKWLTAGLCVATLASVSGIATYMSLAQSGRSTTAEWSDVSISETYVLGGEFSVPERTVTIGGKSAEAKAIVQYPNGDCVDSNKVQLTASGKYTVSYTAEVDGKVFVCEENFTVEYLSYGVNLASSSVEYGEFVSLDGMHTHQGLAVSLQQYDKLSFDNVIDFSNLTQEDALISFFITPETLNQRDFRTMYITFTDVEDPNATMDIRVNGNPDGYGYTATYFLAGVNGGPKMGYNRWNNNIFCDMNYMEWFYGQSIGHNWYGTDSVGGNVISLYYETETSCLYVEDVDHKNYLIADFDNPRFFDELWNGFPSGKARMSITVTDIEGGAANFFVTSVLGADLSTTILGDKIPPIITVENEQQPIAFAKIGGEYPIAKATAYDIYSGKVDVQTAVYYNYVSENNRILIPVKNGKFKTDKVGSYAIVYTATDLFGNVAEKVVWVQTADVSAPDFAVNGLTDTCEVGEQVLLPDPEVSFANGAYQYKTTVVLDGQESLVQGNFRPVKAGNYTVKYTVTDYIGVSTEKSYTLQVTGGENWIVEAEPQFPEYLILGSKYSLPVVYAIRYQTTEERQEASVFVTDADGRREIAKGETYAPNAKAHFELATIEYVVDGQVICSYNIPVALVKEMQDNGRPKLEVENYFSMQGGIVEKTEEAMLITATQERTDAKFINILTDSLIEVKVRAIPSETKAKGLIITLIDAYNPNFSVSLDFAKQGNSTRLTAGSASFDVDSGFDLDSFSNEFVITYQAGVFKVNGASFNVGTYNNGEIFNGFPSSDCYLVVSTYGNSEGSKYMITNLNGVVLNSSTTERAIPKISILGAYGGAKNYGETYDIPIAKATSLLDANIDLRMTVETPSGKVAKDINGVELKNIVPNKVYTLGLDEYGQYLVKYTAVDTFNVRPNDASYTYAIFVVDSIAPMIKLSGNVKSTVKVGDIMVIPKFTVSDNISTADELEVSCYVATNTGVWIKLADGERGVKATAPGTWKLAIYAMDKAGNLSFVTYEITVTA